MRMFVLKERCTTEASYIQAYTRITYIFIVMHVCIDRGIHGNGKLHTVNYTDHIENCYTRQV